MMGLGKCISGFKYGHFLVSMLKFWDEMLPSYIGIMITITDQYNYKDPGSLSNI